MSLCAALPALLPHAVQQQRPFRAFPIHICRWRARRPDPTTGRRQPTSTSAPHPHDARALPYASYPVPPSQCEPSPPAPPAAPCDAMQARGFTFFSSTERAQSCGSPVHPYQSQRKHSGGLSGQCGQLTFPQAPRPVNCPDNKSMAIVCVTAGLGRGLMFDQ